MGIVKKQGLQASIVTYIGLALGYINIVLLFPRILEPEQFGLTRVLISVAAVFAQFAQLGVPHITFRYFPYFNDKALKHKGFLFFSLLIPVAGIVFFTILFFIFQSQILSYYERNSQLFVQYYYFLFPLAIFTLYFDIMFAYACSNLKTVVPSFFKEVFPRIYNGILILVFFLDIISFEQFLYLFILGYAFQVIGLLIYLLWLKQLFLEPIFKYFNKSMIREMLVYGIFVFLAGATSMLINNIDVIMISSLSGLAQTAIYSVAYFIGQVIMVPARAISLTVLPLIADAWKGSNISKIETLYKKTSINQSVIGSLLFIGIWANIDNIIFFMPGEYAGGKYVIFFIGLAKLFEMYVGIVGGLIVTSRFYKFLLMNNVFLVVIIIIANLIFIPMYGIIGAGLATAICVLLVNTINVLFVLIKFKLQPFSVNSLKMLLIGGAVLFFNYFIPKIDNVYLDILIRSSVISLIFGFLVLKFKISSDINESYVNVINRYLKKQ